MAACRKPPGEDAKFDPAGRKRPRVAVGQVAHLYVKLYDRRVKSKHGVGRRVDRDVEAVVVAGGIRRPGQASGGPPADSLFRILHRVRRGVDEAAGRQLDMAVPYRQTIAPANAGARPGDTVAVRAVEGFRSVGRDHPYMVEPAEDVDPLDRPGPGGAPADRHGAVRSPGGPHG